MTGKAFIEGMDLFPVFENRKFKKSDFVVGRRFYVWHSGHGRVELVTHKWHDWYYIERVNTSGKRLVSSLGGVTKAHVYGTPNLERALAAAEFCTQRWRPELCDDPLGTPGFPEFLGE